VQKQFGGIDLTRALEVTKAELESSQQAQTVVEARLARSEASNEVMSVQLSITQEKLTESESLLRAAQKRIQTLEFELENVHRREEVFKHMADEQIALTHSANTHAISSAQLTRSAIVDITSPLRLFPNATAGVDTPLASTPLRSQDKPLAGTRGETYYAYTFPGISRESTPGK